jgi:RNA polymerase sigma-70 factor (ECF subfamily)
LAPGVFAAQTAPVQPHRMAVREGLVPLAGMAAQPATFYVRNPKLEGTCKLSGRRLGSPKVSLCKSLPQIVGTIEKYAHQTSVERMSTKAQEVALDRILVDRFKNGDGAAFDEMVSRYWDRIYAMVHQLLRNQQDAEEVTQDAFIRAHRGLVNFRGDSAFSTWLYQIATNLARNRYWYWWRRKRDKTVSFDQPVSEGNDTPLSEVFAAEVATPEDATVAQEFVDRIAFGMEKLSPKHREILILRNVKNLSYEEIAAILRISVGTVKSRIARARESLRAKMGDDFK